MIELSTIAVPSASLRLLSSNSWAMSSILACKRFSKT